MRKILSGTIVVISTVFLQYCTSSTVQPKETNSTSESIEQYTCLPCGSSCDTILATSPGGTCKHCMMGMVKKSSIVHGNVMPQNLYAHILKAGSSNVLLLDVRTAEEFKGMAPDKFGRLKNAINIPVQELETRIKELDNYKDKEIIVYCSHSHRSPQSSYLLTQNGFKKVTNLQNGMHMWKEQVKDKESNDSLYIAQ
jgi:rhodanese-related sulfurtransferase